MSFDELLNETEDTATGGVADEGQGVEETSAAETPATSEGAEDQTGSQEDNQDGETAVEPVEPASVVEPAAAAEPSELEMLRAQNQSLTERIELLSGQVAAPKTEPVTTDASTSAATDAAKTLLEEFGVKDLDVITSDPEVFESLLRFVITRTQESTVQRVLTTLPQMVANTVEVSMTHKRAVDAFYEVNQDLTTVKKTVALVANEVHSEHPDWTLAQILHEAGTRARKVLGMKEQAAAAAVAAATPATKPAFAGGASGRATSARPQLSAMQTAINDLIE